MRRRASVFHLGRTIIDSLVRRLRIQDVSAWPPPLRQAFSLFTEKLGLEAAVARQVVISATRTAHACAIEISNVALQQERQRTRDQCRRCFKILANNLRLLPAKLRKAAKDVSVRRLTTAHFDADLLEEILDDLVPQPTSAAADSAAKGALKAIYVWHAKGCKGDVADKRVVAIDL